MQHEKLIENLFLDYLALIRDWYAFALYLIWQGIGHRNDVHAGQDGLLISWICRDELRNVWGTRLAWRFWEYRMRNVGPGWCLTSYIGNDYPVFRECAPDRFI